MSEITRLKTELKKREEAIEVLEAKLRNLNEDYIKKKIIMDMKSQAYRLARTGKISRETLNVLLSIIDNLR